MRADISLNRTGWLYKLDYRKVILIAFLARFIFASMYDGFVSVTRNEVLAPDGNFYSVRGRYVSLFLNGYSAESFTKDMIPPDKHSQYIFQDAIKNEGGRFPLHRDESTIFTYIIGLIYFIFGYFPLGVRVFNIALSIGSTYLMFMIARRHFGDLVANVFLLIALFLPSQFVYSLTLTRDFIRVFVVSLTLWVIYGKKG